MILHLSLGCSGNVWKSGKPVKLCEIRGSLDTEYSGLRRRVVWIAAYLTRYYVMTSHLKMM